MSQRHRWPVRVPVVAILALLFSTLLPAPLPASAAGSIHLSRSVAGPRDVVGVSGSGFTPGDNAVVYANFRVQGTTRRVQSAVVVNATGAFGRTLTVPAFTAPGSYTVTASDIHGRTASQGLTVLPAVNLKPGAPPQMVRVIAEHRFFARGSGVQAGETVTLSAVYPLYNGNATTVNRTATADKTGVFWDALLPVPFDAKAQAVILTATGQTTRKSATAKVIVFYAPVISLSPKVMRPGSSTTVHGAGFVPGATVKISITIPRTGSSTITLTTSATADQYGRFTATLGLPSNTRPGTYTVTATGSIAGVHASSQVTVAVTPTIFLPSGVVFPGQTIPVTGGGFSSGVQVTVSATFPLFGGRSTTVSATATTNGNGVFSTHLAIPRRATGGTVTVLARGPNGQASARLQVRPLTVAIVVSPAATRPGGTVTIRGSGFLGNAAVVVSMAVTLTNGSQQTLRATATTNGSGQFTLALHVPGNVRGGTYTVVARSSESGRTAAARLLISRLVPSVSVAPVSVIPGGTVPVRGSGYLPNAKVALSVLVTLTSGAKQTLSATATTNGSGQFSVTIHIPTNVIGGIYSVVARSSAGRAASTRLVVAKLAPSIMAVPTFAVPGTPITVNGFGFAAGAGVTISINGQKLGSATANGAGQFSLKVTVPANLASGSYTLSAASSGGRKASIALTVNRLVLTHFYFASFYTGAVYHEYLAFLNPSDIHARVTISYQLTRGAPRTRTIGINAHSRFTEDVNADLGFRVSAGAVIAADVPIVAERVVYRGTDGAIVPGARSPSTVWYFANGNSGHGYREYIAIANPNRDPVEAAVTFFPSHRRAFTVLRAMAPTSRTTVNVNRYVHKDAVGVRVTANGPVVANRTIFVHHGMTSKIGVTAPQSRWYFAAGPVSGRNWIGAANPSNHWAYVTLHAYGPFGLELGTVKGWLKPHARVGYLINRIARQPDAAVVLMSSRPIVAEQTTYAGRMHNASTDTFGTWAPARNWAFAAASTLGGRRDILDLFNPNLAPIPVVVNFMTTSGSSVQRTYVVAPLAHQRVDVGSVEPNAQLGLVAASNDQFVAMNRAYFAGGLGSDTSSGIHQ